MAKDARGHGSAGRGSFGQGTAQFNYHRGPGTALLAGLMDRAAAGTLAQDHPKSAPAPVHDSMRFTTHGENIIPARPGRGGE